MVHAYHFLLFRCAHLAAQGTVITICPEPTLEYTTPINQRLQQPDSLPRATQDPSILVESLLDLSE